VARVREYVKTGREVLWSSDGPPTRKAASTLLALLDSERERVEALEDAGARLAERFGLEAQALRDRAESAEHRESQLREALERIEKLTDAIDPIPLAAQINPIARAALEAATDPATPEER
jgi:DNA repair exonuclease SbcCD ATPase subunit